ncbi:Glutaminyl-tRNA synthetase [Candidatus Nasuia deltocephalinicola]|uniref:Glutaminyl-tRNA synthetase n=1 Tax=Candidatus Nasuia deltocephalincola TaxID=1160784 RepID=A0A7G6UHR9_9PROT|nr:Glutaminyl-tRNA synthetase [Candidatus Nasuia deltocephalinicola]
MKILKYYPIFRFSPESNWNLHIGNLKNIFINLKFSKIYNGKTNLRIDDTNNYKNKKKYKKIIIKNLKKINIYNDNIFNKYLFYSSNYFFKLYQYIEIILKKIKINKFLLKSRRIKRGDFKEKKYMINILKKNIYRISYKKHHKIGWFWFIYPFYDYSHNIVDKIENIKYSICSSEFKKNKSIYNIITNILYSNIKKSIQKEIVRLNFKNNILSKSKLKKVKNIKYIKNSYDKRLKLLNFLKIKKLKILLKKNKNSLKFKKINIISYFLKIRIKNLNTKKIKLIQLKENIFLTKKIFFKKKFFLKKKKLINIKKKLYLNNNFKYFIYCYKVIKNYKNKIKYIKCKIYNTKNDFKRIKKINFLNKYYKNKIILICFNDLIKIKKIKERGEEKKIIFKITKLNFNYHKNLIKIKKNKITVGSTLYDLNV